MAANAIPNSASIDAATENDSEKNRRETCGPVPLKQRVAKALREVFEGHEAYLGATPD
jgi:hypothetical protein